MSIVPVNKLLVHNVKQGWKSLCDFLECEVPTVAFPHENIKAEIIGTLPATRYGQQVKREVHRGFFAISSVLVIIVGTVLAICLIHWSCLKSKWKHLLYLDYWIIQFKNFHWLRHHGISASIIQQIFSLDCDCSKHFTWPNVPKLKLGNILEAGLPTNWNEPTRNAETFPVRKALCCRSAFHLQTYSMKFTNGFWGLC